MLNKDSIDLKSVSKAQDIMWLTPIPARQGYSKFLHNFLAGRDWFNGAHEYVWGEWRGTAISFPSLMNDIGREMWALSTTYPFYFIQ